MLRPVQTGRNPLTHYSTTREEYVDLQPEFLNKLAPEFNGHNGVFTIQVRDMLFREAEDTSDVTGLSNEIGELIEEGQKLTDYARKDDVDFANLRARSIRWSTSTAIFGKVTTIVGPAGELIMAICSLWLAIKLLRLGRDIHWIRWLTTLCLSVLCSSISFVWLDQFHQSVSSHDGYLYLIFPVLLLLWLFSTGLAIRRLIQRKNTPIVAPQSEMSPS